MLQINQEVETRKLFQRKESAVSRDNLANKMLEPIKYVKSISFVKGPPEAGINSSLTGCDLCIIHKKVDDTDR